MEEVCLGERVGVDFLSGRSASDSCSNPWSRSVLGWLIAIMTFLTCQTSVHGSDGRYLSGYTHQVAAAAMESFTERCNDSNLLSHGKNSIHRSLATTKPDSLLGITEEAPFLVAGLTATPVLTHKIDKRFQSHFSKSANTSTECESFVSNMVFDRGGIILYYELYEKCTKGDSQSNAPFDERFSFWKANMSAVKNQRQNGSQPYVPAINNDTFISYGWSDGNPTGSAITSSPGKPSIGGLPIPGIEGLVLSKSEDNLILAWKDASQSSSLLTSLSTTSGNRSSVWVNGTSLLGLALHPMTTQLYMMDSAGSRGARLLTTDLGQSGLPHGNGTLPLETIVIETLTTDGNEMVENPKIGPSSFDANGSCLYFIDQYAEQLGAVKIAVSNDSNSSEFVSLIVSSTERHLNESELVDFVSLRDLVVTPDGCNVFVAGVAFVHWVKIDSPCERGESVSIVANGTPGKLSGLALRDHSSNLTLYVGATNGNIFELPIDKSRLHNCSASEAFLPASAPSSVFLSAPQLDVLPISSYSPPSVGSETSRYSPSSVFDRSALPSSSLPPPQSSSRSSGVALKIGLPVGALSLIAIIVIVALLRRRRVSPSHPKHTGGSASAIGSRVAAGSSSGSNVEGLGESGPLASHFCKAFTLEALSQCTDKFDSSHKIVTKGHVTVFGEVYRGAMGGHDLAMKVGKADLTDAQRQQFLVEVNTICKLHHSNIVHLVGYCQEGDNSILVYPFFNGGSLHARLHDIRKYGQIEPDGTLPPLSLIERLCIGFQIAKAVHYLHDGVSPPFLHRDIKSSNVLLTDEGGKREVRAVLADCGWATMCDTVLGVTHEQVAKAATQNGTFGYIAPEYLLAAQLSERNDVYSFGVVLLEMLTGKKSVTMAPSGVGCVTLADWVHLFFRDLREGEEVDLLEALLDPSLQEQAEGSAAKQMAMRALILGSSCTDDNEKARPPIGSVAESLRKILEEGNVRSRFSVK